ncbi:MAG: PTS glucose transporter subunit IIA [Eisenbergiella sp.]
MKKGDLLVEADLEKIKEAGYDVITPMIVCNTTDFASVEGKTGIAVKPGDDCLEIKK